MREQIVRFGPDGALMGVVTHPVDDRGRDSAQGVILLSAGLIHHVGPNRLYVKLARDLAARGLPVLRFDFAGLGESARRGENISLEKSVVADVDDALNFMLESVGVRSCILIGHCSGAILSCHVAERDDRVSGLIPLNYTSMDQEWVDFDREEKAARFYLRYYLTGVLTNATKWRRFFSGQADYSSVISNLLRGVLRGNAASLLFRLQSRLAVCLGRAPTSRPGNLSSQRPVQSFGLDRIVDRGVHVAFIFSESNPGLEYVRAVTAGRLDALVREGRVGYTIVSESDHGFSSLAAQRKVGDAVREFVTAWQPVPAVAHATR